MKYCISAWNWRDSRTVSKNTGCPECPVIMIIYLHVFVGPRFVLNPIKIFAGSFGGATLWANPDYQSPNLVSCVYHCFILPALCKWIKLHSCCFYDSSYSHTDTIKHLLITTWLSPFDQRAGNSILWTILWDYQCKATTYWWCTCILYLNSIDVPLRQKEVLGVCVNA